MLEQSSQPMKIALSVLFVALLAALVLIVLAQRGLLGKKALAPQPAATTSQSKTGTATPTSPTSPTSPTATQQQAVNGGQTVSPAAPTIPIEDAQKQLKAIQGQVNAGTLSSEEAQKQMNVIIPQIAPPALPPVKK